MENKVKVGLFSSHYLNASQTKISRRKEKLVTRGKILKCFVAEGNGEHDKVGAAQIGKKEEGKCLTKSALMWRDRHKEIGRGE